jgi:hypothetical protein
MGDKKAGKDPEAAPVYTFVDCGIPGRGFNIWGYLTREQAIARARRHYTLEAAKVHHALEALEKNAIAVRYTRNGNIISSDYALRVHRKLQEAAGRLLPRVPKVRNREKQAASPRA